MFAYKTIFKEGTCHTPFQLVYGLHALMLTKYLLFMTNFATSEDFTMIEVFIIQLSKLETLEESWTLIIKTISMWQWNHALWTHNHYLTKSFSLVDHLIWFPKARKEHTSKFKQSIWTIQDSILFTKQFNTFGGCKQVWSQPHLSQHQQTEVIINPIPRHNYF